MPFVTIANQKIYYTESGARQHPIVFIHGAAASHLVWGLQLNALRDYARTITLDLPGHGRSDLPGRNTIDGYHDVILGLLDELKLERAILVGHSMGGAIAQATALANPDRATGLVLVGTGARLRVMPAIIDGVLNNFDEVAELVIDNSYAASLDAAMRERALAEFRACPPQVTHGDFIACDNFDMRPHLSAISAPTLVMCGDQDRMAPHKFSEYLATRIPHAQLVVISNAGHSVMIEQPDAFNLALVDFARKLVPP